MNILVADDSDFIRASIIKSLQKIDKLDIFFEAKDVNQAIDLVKKFQPEIVLIDIKMPGGNGFDVLKAVKEQKEKSLTIMLTNYTFPHYKDKSLNEGADFFFDKATDFDKVFSIIDDYSQQTSITN
jgi:DNA-binding NarL/FixJ family response regulator